MLLKLIPVNSEPTIHFSLSFADLPPNIPTPAAWTAQLAQLMLEEVEVPATMHSLDRSAGVTSLLEEVALDVGMCEIRCRFVDGKVERWGFGEGILGIGSCKEIDGSHYGKRLADALDGIVRNVKESTLEDERVAHEREWEKKRLERSRSMSSATMPKLASTKVTKHKKQRSFFMQILSSVGSIINLQSPSTSSHPSLPLSRSSTSTAPSNHPSSLDTPPTTSTHTSPPPPPGTSVRARALRRAARSSLVDTYRQFILSELVRRIQGPTFDITNLDRLEKDVVPHHQQPLQSQEYRRREQVGFNVWILHSMRRRALERMEQLLEVAEAEAKSRGHISGVNPDLNSVGLFGMMEPATTAVPLSFSDDEDEVGEVDRLPPGLAPTKSEKEADGDSDSDTETDGSSVHTPSTTSHFQCYPFRPPLSRTSSASSHSGLDDSSLASHEDKAQQDPENQADTPSPPVPPKDLPRILQYLPSVSNQPIPPPAPRIIQYLSSASLHEYTQLLELRARLGHLLLFSASQARVTADEAQSRLAILAVRSKRRAWSNRALSLVARSQAGVGGAAMYGLVTPFRSSCLTRYMWTAEDLAHEPSSSSSSPSNTLTRCSLRTAFPSYRPRLRPKIQYDVEAALAADVNANPFVNDDELEPVQDYELHPLVEREFEMYEEASGPSPLGGRVRRHVRGGTRKLCVSSTSARALSRETGRSGIGRLFPVSEEIDGEVQDHFPDEDQVFAFAVRGRQHRNERRTFMGCDEVRVEGEDEDEDGLQDPYTYGGDVEAGDGLEDPHELDLEFGFGEFHGGEVPYDIDPNAEMGLGVEMERPKILPRVRTTSMMGTFVHRTKGAQSAAFHAASHQSRHELTKDSLLCQPISASVASYSPHKGPPPKLQTQSQIRLKMTSASSDSSKVSHSSSPAIYTDIEVDLELDVQVRVGEYVPDTAGYAPCDRQEEFTLSMDLPSGGRRNRTIRRLDYPMRPLSRHEFEENRRPKLGSIFVEPIFSPNFTEVTP